MTFNTVVKLKAKPAGIPDSFHVIFPFYLYESGEEKQTHRGNQTRPYGAGFDSLSGAVARFCEHRTEVWEGIPIEAESESG